MKHLLKYLAVFVIISAAIPLTAVYFGSILSEMKRIFTALL